MAPLVQLLALAIIAGHGAFSQVLTGSEFAPAPASGHDDDDVSEVYTMGGPTQSSPLAVCSDDQCQKCVAAPEIRVGKLTWPACVVHNVTDILKDQPGFEEVVSGAKQAFFKIPEPVHDGKTVIRKPVTFPDAVVQNCGMVTALYTKAACVAQPRGENQFMVQSCSGEQCPGASPKHAKRADDTQEPDGPKLWECYRDEEHCQTQLLHETCLKKDKTLCQAAIHSPEGQGTSLCFEEGNKCVPLKKRKKQKKLTTWPLKICDGGQCKEQFCANEEEWCDVNLSCPAMKLARPGRGIKADPHNPYGARARAELYQRYDEANNVNMKFGLNQNFGDLLLSSMKLDRDQELPLQEREFRELLFKTCMTERANWLPFGRYKKVDERTYVLGQASGSLTAKVEVPWTTSLEAQPNSLGSNFKPVAFVKDVFAAALHQSQPACGIRDLRTEKVDAPAHGSGQVGFTPILDCTLAMHACGNWMGDTQIHEFCVPTLGGKKKALGVVGLIETN